jgi:oligo-1,6-glucosidase
VQGMLKSTALNFVDPARNELNMGYHFDGASLGYIPGYFKNGSKLEFSRFQENLDWDAVCDKKRLGNNLFRKS